MAAYRPWGHLDWVLTKADVPQWGLFGCLGTEDRSTAAWKHLFAAHKLTNYRLLRIANLPSRFDDKITTLEAARVADFESSGGNRAHFEQHDLMEADFKIVSSIDNFIQQAAPNVILDVSALPKRFFFPALKRILKSAAIQNFLITYSIPGQYTEEKLGENVEDWDHLPLFTGAYSADRPQMMIISVGFEAFRLQERVEHGDSSLPIKLLFPFPSPPTGFRRNWELVRKLQRHRSADDFTLYHTSAREVGDAFDRLVSLTSSGQRPAILAPFGPKPVSVAICIFATLTGSEVFYTQPTVYHADYSSGVALHDNVPLIYCYCVRLGGRDYFTV